MLDLVRKHARSWLIKVALFLIVIVFIFWGGYSYKTRQEGQMARVGERYISIHEYDQYYNVILDRYRQQLKESFSEDLMRQMNIKKQALSQLIDRLVISTAAEHMGLTATTEEVQRKLLEFPVFQTDGLFDKKRYEIILRQNRLSPETFEQQMGQDLTLQKVEAFVKRRAQVTEQEITADFRLNHALIETAYLFVDPKTFESLVSADEKALQEYYQQHQERYMDPEKRQVSYVLFNPTSFLPEVKLTENQVREYYEDHRTDYNKEQEVHARHILFTVKEDAPEGEVARVRAEAEKVLAEVREGKDFGELAAKYSQDPTAAESGGDVGFFNRGRVVPAFADAAFSLKPGEVSELVRTPFGFHIIKVEEIRPAKAISIEEAQSEIESKLKAEIARDMAHRKGRELADVAYAQKDIGKAAQAMKIPLSGTGVWMTQRENLAEVGAIPMPGMTKLFALPEKGISDVLEVPKGFLIVQVDAIQAPQMIPFDKAKERVEREYKLDQSRVLAQKKASEVLERARAVNSLEQAGAEAGIEVKKSGWFSRKQPDGELPSLQGDAKNKLFELEESRPFSEAPFMLGGRYGVFQLLGRKIPQEALEKERPEITKRLLEEKQMVLWQAWVGEERRKAQIEIYKEP